ncbi:MAG: IspD/TarI family cytidylyltransferase [Microthrixaceae bacterium]
MSPPRIQDDTAVAPAGGTWCIVVGGGSGRRYGGAKQFEELVGTRVVDRSVRTAAAVCDGVVLVLPAASLGSSDAAVPGATTVVAGGATRADSVRAGLAAVPQDAGVVLVHDAARPLASVELFRRVDSAVRSGARVVVPATAVVDTIRRVDGGVVDRDTLRAVQTPQGFDAELLREVHATGAEGTDDAGLAEVLGVEVVLVEGEPTNLKLTGPEDRIIAAALVEWLDRPSDRPLGAPDPA